MTKDQLVDLRASGNKKLLGVVDVSCDIGGAFEMLTHSTYPEAPYYVYDPAADASSASLDTDGLLMCGVDILPSELPKEASAHFGDALLAGGFAEALANLDPSVSWAEAQASLPVELSQACIAADGALTTRWEYIDEMRAANERNAGAGSLAGAEVEGSTVIELSGHLFDSGLLNGVLDLIEQQGANFAIVDMNVRPNAATAAHASTAHVQISASGGRVGLESLLSAVSEMAASTGGAEAAVVEIPGYCNGDYGMTTGGVGAGKASSAQPRVTFQQNPNERAGESVLVLGAGLVAGPAVEMLSRPGGRQVVLVSGIEGEADAMVAKLGRGNVSAATMDCTNVAAVRAQVAASSSVLSLLPATMHQEVALASIDSGVPLVTASYVSEEMFALQSAAAAAGIPILGEMGLDPGMDHMSAMEMIDAAAASGASVRSFKSVCGGLPAPEAANNMLRYKFSWSPRGVLSAASNDAQVSPLCNLPLLMMSRPSLTDCLWLQWLENGEVIQVDGSGLLAASNPIGAFPTLNLECLPNRDSLPYKEAYKLQDAETVYRGTLRFNGFCDRVLGLQKLGLLNGAAHEVGSFAELFAPNEAVEAGLEAPQRECLEWLRAQAAAIEADHAGRSYPTKLDALTAVLENIPALQFEDHERDMCALQHELEIMWTEAAAKNAGLDFVGGSGGLMLERRISRMIAFGSEEKGGDTAMAKTVGLTAACGVELMLGGSRPAGGVHIPVSATTTHRCLRFQRYF